MPDNSYNANINSLPNYIPSNKNYQAKHTQPSHHPAGSRFPIVMISQIKGRVHNDKDAHCKGFVHLQGPQIEGLQ
jgi:hypothetical protein